MFVSKANLKHAEEVGLFKSDVTATTAKAYADYILKDGLRPSTTSRKLTQVRKIMREAGASKEAVDATLRPEVTISAQKEHFRMRAANGRKITTPALYSTGAKVLDRLVAAAGRADEAVEETSTIVDLFVALSARPTELLPGHLKLTAKKRGRGIGAITVSGMLKKRGKVDTMPLVSIAVGAKHRAALMKLFRAFRDLPIAKQTTMVNRARTMAKSAYSMNLKDLRNIGAELAVLANAPASGLTGVDRHRLRAAALRHTFDEGRLPASVAYDNVAVKDGSVASDN